MSVNPAKVLGIDKGCIDVGKCADIAVVNVSESFRIDAGSFVSKGRNTPFDGMEARGKVVATVVDGKVVYTDAGSKIKKTKLKMTAKVASQSALGEGLYSMEIEAPEIAKQAKPGQFLSVYSRDRAHLLPRPISICEIKGNCLRIVYRVVGAGTEEFSTYQAGDELSVMGPLGNGFPMEAAEGRDVLVIGGGIGIFPMLEVSRQLARKGIAQTVVLGYRGQVFMKEEFEENGQVFVATEDGSQGTKGNVLDAIREQGLGADLIFACGPAPMLRAVKQYAQESRIPAWISMEERMACGIGACLACVCKSVEADEHTNVHHKRVCKDGPVFLADEVELW